jgi:hypothetical protein
MLAHRCSAAMLHPSPASARAHHLSSSRWPEDEKREERKEKKKNMWS